MLAQRTAVGVAVVRSRPPGRGETGGFPQHPVGERDDLAQATPIEQSRDVAGGRLGDALRVPERGVLHVAVPVRSPLRGLLVNLAAVDGLVGRLAGCSHRPSQPSAVRTPSPFPLRPNRKPPLAGPHTGDAERAWDNGRGEVGVNPPGKGNG